MRLARTSSCWGRRKKNEGSGLMLNGFWVKPKKALYMFTGCQQREIPSVSGRHFPYFIMRPAAGQASRPVGVLNRFGGGGQDAAVRVGKPWYSHLISGKRRRE